MKARNDENLEGIQSLARGLGRLLPRGGARGEAIAELQARLEAAERERDEYKEAAAAEAQLFNEAREEMNRRGATLAAVRKWRDKTPHDINALDAILDGEGEKCPTCGGRGIVATSGPDEFGNYETDDCPDGWHT